MRTHVIRPSLFQGLLSIPVAALMLPSAPAAALGLPPVLSDGVVFQQGRPIRFWGTAKPGEKVTVEWGKLTQTTSTSPNGNWRLEFPAAEKAFGESILVRGSGGEQLRIREPSIGQVWLCGGQSNMAMQLKRTDQASMAGQALPAPARVRLFRAPTPDVRRPNEGVWVDDAAATASGFSAVCYLTGRMLATHSRGLVGLIDTSVGATSVEAWMPESARGAVNGLSRGPTAAHSMASLGSAFDAVVKPIAPFSVKGLLWYQGEGDYRRNPTRYADLFVATMREWRKSFGRSDLPIVYMQLPVFETVNGKSGWEEVRNQQAKAERMLPGLLMAPSQGIRATEIHPTDKMEVARRLFLRATGSTP